MSATIIQLRSSDPRDEDPFHHRLGVDPFRQTFPLWKREPATFSDWLAGAEGEFGLLGACEASQRTTMADMEAVARRRPEVAAYLQNAFASLSRRHAARAQALQGEAIRTRLVYLRAASAEPIKDADLWGLLAAMTEASP